MNKRRELFEIWILRGIAVEIPLIAARVIGRQMKPILHLSKELEKRLTSILEREIRAGEKSQMVKLMVQGTNTSMKDALALLKEILIGIQETRD